MPGKADAVRLIPKANRAVIMMGREEQSIVVVLIVTQVGASWADSARECERCGKVTRENVQKLPRSIYLQ